MSGASSARRTTRSTARSRSSASWSTSSRPAPRTRSSSTGRVRSRRCARQSARRIPPKRRRARFAATSRWRCRTISSTAPTRPSRRSARSRCGSRTMSSSDVPEGLAGNIADWTRTNAEYTDPGAARAWAGDVIAWGVFQVREEDLGSPLGNVKDLDVVDLGCGTAYFSAKLAKRGARPVGVDPTPARLLRPGGRLVFLTNSVLAYLCFPDDPGHADEHLHRPQAGMYVTKWPGEEGTEYHLSHGDWIDLLHANGFELERLVEVYAPPGAEDHGYYETVTAEWAQKWP